MAPTNNVTDGVELELGLELRTVDPSLLVIRDQAREDATPDEQLVESVQRHGIIQPPVVEEDAETGELVIVTGHRRVGAAIRADRQRIVVLVRPLGGPQITLEQQIVENERRKQLSPMDLAKGYEQLTLFGLRPEDIAAELGERPDRVRAGLKVVKSEKVRDLVAAEPTIDLERAAIIAEFDQHPKLQAKLIEAATTRPENFARDVESARRHREVDARVERLRSTLAEDDVTVVDVSSWDHYYWRGEGARGRSLKGLNIPVEEHVECPGHAAVIHKAQAHFLNEQPSEWILYVCTDWKANGHVEVSTALKKTPEELEREVEWRRQEEERQAARELIEANTRARRSWLHSHLTTGRLRPTAHHFEILADSAFAEAAHQEGIPFHIVRQLLDGKEYPRDKWNEQPSEESILDLLESRHTPALRLALAIAIARIEENPDSVAAARYWPALAALGYPLTDTDKEHQASTIAALAEWKAERAGETADADEGAEE